MASKSEAPATNIPRLNGVIKAWEQGKVAFVSFSPPDRQSAIQFATSDYDGVVFEMEHNAFDPNGLQDTLQYLLDRKRIAKSGSIAPSPTPFVRIPPNGDEMNQFCAKQVLDRGVYGVVWPHINSVEQAINAVTSCRYPRPKSAPYYEPPGKRGDGPTTARRYWGLSQQDYYKKADVWPIDPNGEILVILMIEDALGVQNLSDILKNVPGIGVCLIGEGDLSQDLGVPRQYDHPLVREAMAEVRARCEEHKVAVGHPHVNAGNIERVLEEGYRFVMVSPEKTFIGLEKGRALNGR